MDEMDGNCIGRGKQEAACSDTMDINRTSQNRTVELPKGTALMSSSKHALYYNMNHERRGLAYIFNHQKFDKCSERHGTDVDSKNLQSCFRSLQFDVQSFRDLKLAELKDQIDMAVNSNHANYDCFVMVILTHGDVGLLWAQDRSYNPELEIFNKFTSDKCPNLAGKPKMFFIQACQGSGLDSGTTLVDLDRRLPRTETDGLREPYRIPVLSDFLIMFATFQGQYAFRNDVKGAYFIRVLCEELENTCQTRELLTILTVVIRRVAVDFQSYNDKNKEYHNRKQIPYFQSTLTRLVHFGKEKSDMDSVPERKFISLSKK